MYAKIEFIINSHQGGGGNIVHSEATPKRIW